MDFFEGSDDINDDIDDQPKSADLNPKSKSKFNSTYQDQNKKNYKKKTYYKGTKDRQYFTKSFDLAKDDTTPIEEDGQLNCVSEQLNYLRHSLEDKSYDESLLFSVFSVTYAEDASKMYENDYIELTGKTSDGQSIKVDFDFLTYFYMEAPQDFVNYHIDNDNEDESKNNNDGDNLKTKFQSQKKHLNNVICAEIKSQLPIGISKFIVNIEYEELQPARPYQFGKKKKLFKFSFNKRAHQYNAETYLKNMDMENVYSENLCTKYKNKNYKMNENDKVPQSFIKINGKKHPIILYELNIKPVERFCQTTLNSSGWMRCNRWIDLPTNKNDFAPYNVQTDVHIRTELKHMSLETNPLYRDQPPLYKAMIFDIETSGLDVESKDASVYQISQVEYNSITFETIVSIYTWNPHAAEDLYKSSKSLRKANIEKLTNFLTAVKEEYKNVDIRNVNVINCQNEKDVLQRWVKGFIASDPDCIGGHNVHAFDMHYLLRRADFHRIQQYEYMGRTGAPNERIVTNTSRYGTSYHGFPGRLQLDTMTFLQGFDESQPSYSLETCSELHVKDIGFETDIIDPAATVVDKKDDTKDNESKTKSTTTAPPTKLERLLQLSGLEKELVRQFNDSKETNILLTNKKGDVEGEKITEHFYSREYEKRHKLTLYCVKDSILTLRLFICRNMFIKVWKMANIFRAPMQLILTGGKQDHVMPNILNKMYLSGFFFNKYHEEHLDPYRDLWDYQEYPGGLVRAPIPRKYEDPVAVGDFASMYPSIQMEYNVCMGSIIPASCLSPEEHEELIRRYKSCGKLIEKEVELGKKGKKIVREKIYIIRDQDVGFTPQIQKEMKQWRGISKENKELAKTEATKSIFDCEQLAIKIYMNGMYGLFAPRQGGRFAYLFVAATITQYGRDLSHIAGERILQHPLIRDTDSTIVYGDTDSLMVRTKFDKSRFKTEAELIEYAFRIYDQVISDVSNSFNSEYIKIELEKIYYPLILYEKKKYYIGRKFPGFSWKKDPVTKKNCIDPITNEKIMILKPVDKKVHIVGVEGKKRDRCEDLRELQYRIIPLLVMTTPSEALIEEELTRSLFKLANNEVPLHKLVIVKGLSKPCSEYSGTLSAHVQVAKKIQKREGVLANKGTRISYIIYTEKTKYNKATCKSKQPKVGQYAEDYKWASQHPSKFIPDTKFYITNHYKKALAKLIKPIDIDFDRLYKKPEEMAMRTANIGQTQLTHFMQQKPAETENKNNDDLITNGQNNTNEQNEKMDSLSIPQQKKRKFQLVSGNDKTDQSTNKSIKLTQLNIMNCFQVKKMNK